MPKSWTEALGISEDAYHLVAVTGGLIAGAATLLGLVILVYRRRTVGPVFSATTRMDKLMYVFLAAVIVLGIWNTLAASTFGHYDYREDVSPWFRSIFLLQPKPELMADAALGFQVHALIAFGLFALWPFTRLVHVFSAPLGYVTRPYIVYRSRDEEREGTGRPSAAGRRRVASRSARCRSSCRHPRQASPAVAEHLGGPHAPQGRRGGDGTGHRRRQWHEGSDDDRAQGSVTIGLTMKSAAGPGRTGSPWPYRRPPRAPRTATGAVSPRTRANRVRLSMPNAPRVTYSLAAVQQQAEDEDGDDVDAHERAEQQVQPDQGVRVQAVRLDWSLSSAVVVDSTFIGSSCPGPSAALFGCRPPAGLGPGTEEEEVGGGETGRCLVVGEVRHQVRSALEPR